MYHHEIFIKFGWVWNLPLKETYEKLFKYYVSSKALELNIESNGAQQAIVLEMVRRGIHSSKSVVNTENKHLRIVKNIQQNWHRIYFGPNVQPEYMEQLLNYEEPVDYGNAKKTNTLDVPDSLAGLISKLTTSGWKMVSNI